ncbi:MAG: hypothetical protein WAR37_02135 [Candidatus Microsaccharimonas sp.]
MKYIKKIALGVFSFFAVSLLLVTPSYAQSANVTQQINAGSLSAAILDASRVTVASPSFGMTAAGYSFSCQTVTGTLGSSTQRLYVINPSATTSGQAWNLSFAATGPWTSGGNSYAYNGSGCTTGQLTVNPAAGTVTADCSSSACTGATISKGSSTAMSGSTAITVLSAPVGTTIWRGYITGVGLSQQIPAEQPTGSYALPVTLTATAS